MFVRGGRDKINFKAKKVSSSISITAQLLIICNAVADVVEDSMPQPCAGRIVMVFWNSEIRNLRGGKGTVFFWGATSLTILHGKMFIFVPGVHAAPPPARAFRRPPAGWSSSGRCRRRSSQCRHRRRSRRTCCGSCTGSCASGQGHRCAGSSWRPCGWWVGGSTPLPTSFPLN